MSDNGSGDEARAKFLGKVLRHLRDEVGLNRPDFTKAMSAYPGGGVKPDYINKLEGGVRTLAKASPEIREAIRLVTGVSREDWEALTGLYVPEKAPQPARPRNVNWVYEAMGISKPSGLLHSEAGARYVDPTGWVVVPVRGLSAAGPAFYSESNVVGTIKLLPTDYDPNHEIVRVVGDSMTPTLREGDHVAVDPTDLMLVENRVYVFHVLGDGHVIKRVKRLADGKLWMTSDNTAHPPMRPDEVEVRGRAVLHIPQSASL